MASIIIFRTFRALICEWANDLSVGGFFLQNHTRMGNMLAYNVHVFKLVGSMPADDQNQYCFLQQDIILDNV